MSFGGWDAIFDKRIFAIHKDKEIFVIKQINIIEEQQLLVKFFLHECEYQLLIKNQYVSRAKLKSFTRLPVKMPYFPTRLLSLHFDSAYFH